LENVESSQVTFTVPNRLEIRFEDGGKLVVPWHLVKAYAEQP